MSIYIYLFIFKFIRKDDVYMFTPLAMGTNHMLGVDNYVPLTTNPA